MSKYKLIQLTNQQIGSVAAGGFMPLGRITRRLNSPTNYCTTFNVTTSDANLIEITEPGYYKVTYSLTGLAGAAGVVAVNLMFNSTNVYSVSEIVAAEGDAVNLTLPYVVRTYANCDTTPASIPASIQMQLGDVAITGATSNIIIEKVQ